MSPLISFSGCDNCSLKKEWPHLRNPRMPMTLPEIKGPHRLLALGEGPGLHEDLKGRQFIGPTGDLLRKYIPGSWEKKLYWNNIVRCRPPKNRDPEAREIQCCSKYLEEDLLSLKPHAILGLGGFAFKYFWQATTETSLSDIRGIPFPVKLSDGTPTWFFPSFHPSYPARSDRKLDDGRVVNPVLPVFKNDIKRFFANADLWLTPPTILERPTNLIYPRTKEEARNLFYNLKQPYIQDIETFKQAPYERDARVLVTGYSDGDTTFSFPVRWPGHLDFWGEELFLEFARTDRTWVAQGAAFELRWLIYHSQKQDMKFEDLEAHARLIHKRIGVNSLAELSRIYLGVDVKKLTDIDTKRLLDYPLEKVLEYNALDCWAEAKTLPLLQTKMSNRDWENYPRILKTIRSTVAMELRGLEVDLKESEKLNKDLLAKERIVEEKIRALKEVKEFEEKEKRIFSVSSPKVVGYVMVEYCGIPLPKSEKTEHLPSDKAHFITDDDVLKNFKDDYPIAQHTLDWREIDKQRGTYVEPILSGELLGIDRRLHPAYTACHTRTYRTSSFNPNMQNFPKREHREIRRQIIALPGKILVSADYGQLEARVIDMESKDISFRNSILKGEDIHSYWLDRICYYYPQYLSILAATLTAALGRKPTDKELRKYARDIVKNSFVFASFYGALARSISARTMIPIEIVNQVWAEFWVKYSGVKKWADNQFLYYQSTGTVYSLTGRERGDVMHGNEPLNTPTQGTGAELVLEAQNALFDLSFTEKDSNLMPRINIHDDLTFELPDDSDLERNIKRITDEMVKPRFPFIIVPLLAEVSIGYNFCDMEEIGKFEGAYYELN